MAPTNVKSEIAPLKKVCLHRPGDELLNLTPDTLEELLFDDIPYLPVAQEEHDAFAKILEGEGVEVLYLEKLTAEALDTDPPLRDKFTEQWMDEANITDKTTRKAVREYLASEYPDTLDFVKKTMAGITLQELDLNPTGSLELMVSDASKLVAAPMPNLYFTRDPFAMIGHGVSLNHMFSHTRNRETIYGQYIFAYHPIYKAVPEFYDRNAQYHIEGGDVLNLNDHTLAIGISQRTEPAAIDTIARNIFGNSESTIDTIVAFNIPVSRAFMHLDTVFTQIDHDKFTIHPAIMGPLQVFEIKPDGVDGLVIRERDGKLEDILSGYLGIPVQLIPCGGGDRIAAAREQWNDGSNTLCIRPGAVVVYQRNNVTNDVLYQNGIDVIEMPSAELSRGRGGPRCMSMPFYRNEM